MDSTLAQPVTAVAVEIDIVRHEAFYFYNRRENGRGVVTAQRIAPERARGIVEANDDAEQYVTGKVTFSPEPCQWTWTAKLTV